MSTLVQNNLRQWRIRRYLRRRGVKVYTRRQWGSEYPTIYAYRRRYKPVAADPADTVVQHITVTFDEGPLKGEFFNDVQKIERIGYQRFGSGISYNAVVDMFTGAIAEGQPLDAKGTHTINDKGVGGYSYDQNLVARAVAVLGMPDTPLSPKAERSIVLLLRAWVKFGAITEGFDYVPHSLFAAKDCPCDNTRSRMEKIRARVGRRR